MTREAYDDLKRRWRDREINSQKYSKITKQGALVGCRGIRVSGTLVKLGKPIASGYYKVTQCSRFPCLHTGMVVDHLVVTHLSTLTTFPT